ncbi:MAG: cob(I)yrinic acid a,c-diamide adenosyltransferase, partial [Megasphaera micronuciformis]
MMNKGLIHIYCGDGKGKTTASIGLTIRCVGRGGKVLFVQFLKDRKTGDIAVLST